MSDAKVPPWAQETTVCAYEVELRVQRGPSAGECHVLRDFPVFVGRGADVDIRLSAEVDDRTLSRRHLKISVEGGRVVVVDLSTNGTWVGKQHLKPHEPVPVNGSDPIWLGPRTMITLQMKATDPEAFLAEGPPVAQDVGPREPVKVETQGAAGDERGQSLALLIDVLGEGRVTAGGIDVQVLPARKAMVLLVCLADGPSSRSLSAERLVDLLWPDNLNDARAALQTTVSRLRRAFRAAATTLPDPIEHTSAGYRISPQYSVRLDARLFEQCCDEAAQHLAASAKAAGSARFEEGLALYQGAFLEGHTDDWVVNRRRTLEGRYFDAVDALSVLRLEEGASAAAARLLEAALEREPCREASMLGLLRALSAMGRRDEALRRYGDFVRVLKKQMGLTPGPEMLLLHETLKGQGTA